jgi:hypothetical protein
VSDDFDQIFGVSRWMCPVVWTKLHLDNVDGVRLEHLLWALVFMKVYSSQKALTKMWGSPSYQTFSKWSWIVIDAIEARRYDEVGCFYSFYFFSDLSLSRHFLIVY